MPGTGVLPVQCYVAATMYTEAILTYWSTCSSHGRDSFATVTQAGRIAWRDLVYQPPK